MVNAPPKSPSKDGVSPPPQTSMAMVADGRLEIQERLRQLFKFTKDRLHPGVAALFADIGADKPISLLYHSKSVSDIDAIQMRQELFDALLEEITRAATAKANVYHRDGKKHILLGAPLLRRGAGSELECMGAIAVLVDDAPKEKLQLQLHLLETLTALISSTGVSAPVAANEAAEPPTDDSASRLAQALAMSSPKEIAYQLANSLANSYQCEQVAIGLIARNKVKLLSVSGASDIKANSRGILLAHQAMNECADNNCRVAFPLIEGDDGGAATLLHAQWSAATSNANVVSLPLAAAGQPSAVVSLRRHNGTPFQPKELEEISQQLTPFGPAFLTLNKADRSLGRHFVDAWAQRFTPTTARAVKTIVITAFTCLSVWLSSGKMAYQPRCSAELSPVNVRQIACPHEAVLSVVHVREGQSVQQGDLLVEFDSTKMQLERNVLISQLQEAEARLSETLTSHDPSNMAIERAKHEVIRNRIASIDDRLKFTQLTAPEDGIVTRCDLATKIGQPFRFGDPLIELVDTGLWKVKIMVPDTIVSDIEPGQTGVFIPYGRPHDAFEFQLTTLRGSAEQIEGANVFVAEAELGERREWMRSGMKGFAKVNVGSRSVYWVWFHDTYDWLCLQMWF